MKITLLFLVLLLQLLPTTVDAAYYQWVDSAGVTHFTDDPDKIPAKYKKRAKKLELQEERSDAAAPAPQAAAPQAAAPRPARIGGQSEQWWRERFGTLRGELSLQQKLLAEKQARLVELRRKRAIYTRAQDREAVNAMQAEVSAVELHIAELQKQLSDLDLQASQASVPVGWRQ